LQSYCIRDKGFKTSKRPVAVPEDAPETIRRMGEVAALVGVGPMFTFPGALAEHVGRTLARSLPEVTVVNGGDTYAVTRRPSKLTVYRREGQALSVVIRPEQGPAGVYTTEGSLLTAADSADAVVVVADSCVLADAVAAAVLAILSHPRSFAQALRLLRTTAGVRGGIVVRDERIGLAGHVELAA
ncbi:MAG TPA: hypothetical protein VEO00_00260, partial [Actinomycetota bacterium]|nr:hypothetical protein [Actinomycetota bacterium]